MAPFHRSHHRYSTILLLLSFAWQLLRLQDPIIALPYAHAFVALLPPCRDKIHRSSGVAFRQHIHTKLLLAAKPTTKRRTWDESYEILLEYRMQHENCNVPINFKDDPKLANWVRRQRYQYKKGNLSKERMEKLNEIGFQFELKRDFDDNYQKLIQYKDQFGDCNVPQRFEDDHVLGSFVHKTRANYNKGSLPKWKVDKLNEIGFVWNQLDNDWWKMYQQLATYHKIHGHCDVPTTVGGPLEKWVSYQRQNQKFLSESQTKALNNLGFTWTGVQEKKQTNQWMQRFEELKEYKRIHGHTRVPGNSGSLGTWVCEQRSNYNNGNLQEGRKELLESIDFAWRLRERGKIFSKANEERWFAAYDKLVEFKKQHNHTLVPTSFKEDPFLNRWVHRQRANSKKGTLRNDRKQMLEKIGFVWSFDDIFEQQWQIRYANVAAFYQENGHWPNIGPLLVWTRRQQWRKANGTLELHRERLLDDINFDWSGPKQ